MERGKFKYFPLFFYIVIETMEQFYYMLLLKLLFLGAVIFKAIADSDLKYTGTGTHYASALEHGLMFGAVLYTFLFWQYLFLTNILAYILIRAGAFNPAWNIRSKRKHNVNVAWTYAGTTDEWFDNLILSKLQKLEETKFPLLMFFYFICLFFGMLM